jgi:hypothetical protein
MHTFNELMADFDTAQKALEKLQKVDAPKIMGVESVRIIKQNIDPIQGYDSGAGVAKWRPRSDKTNAAYDRNRSRAAAKSLAREKAKTARLSKRAAKELKVAIKQSEIAKNGGPSVAEQRLAAATKLAEGRAKAIAKAAATRAANLAAGKYKSPRRGGNSTYKGSVYSSQNPLLYQTGVLYRGIKYVINGSNVSVGVDFGLIPYAQTMNAGSLSRNIPARQYLPVGQPNLKIINAVLKKFDYERDRIMKKFKR